MKLEENRRFLENERDMEQEVKLKEVSLQKEYLEKEKELTNKFAEMRKNQMNWKSRPK